MLLWRAHFYSSRARVPENPWVPEEPYQNETEPMHGEAVSKRKRSRIETKPKPSGESVPNRNRNHAPGGRAAGVVKAGSVCYITTGAPVPSSANPYQNETENISKRNRNRRTRITTKPKPCTRRACGRRGESGERVLHYHGRACPGGHRIRIKTKTKPYQNETETGEAVAKRNRKHAPGGRAAGVVKAGSVCYITTGAPVPEGADAVVMIEARPIQKYVSLKE